jgi:uncharacterized protein YycO
MENILFKVYRRFLTWIGDIFFATSPPKVKAEHIRKMMEEIQPGDVLCRRYVYYLDSYLIPGKYSHSGVVVDLKTMVHSIAEGVQYIDVIDYVKDCDGFIILRPQADAAKVIDFARNQVGKPYDFLFDIKEKSAFYCHELTFYSLAAGGLSIVLSGGGRAIYASDIIDNCEKIYEV